MSARTSELCGFSVFSSAFEAKNGVRTQEEMPVRIEKYRRAPASPKEDYSIGCILLESPFFFDRTDWIPLPDWQKQTEEKDSKLRKSPENLSGSESNQSCKPDISSHRKKGALLSGKPKFGAPQIILPRLGQNAARSLQKLSEIHRTAGIDHAGSWKTWSGQESLGRNSVG